MEHTQPRRDTAAVSGTAFRLAMSEIPGSVAVITAPGPHGPVGCTATGVLSLSLRPPSMLVSLGNDSGTLARILAEGTFAVNTLAHHDRALVHRFAAGTAQQRFTGVPWERVRGVPVLRSASVSVVCTVSETVSVLDHTLVVGTAVWTRVSPAPPLVLHRGSAEGGVLDGRLAGAEEEDARVTGR